MGPVISVDLPKATKRQNTLTHFGNCSHFGSLGLENITYQMTLMPYKQQSTHLAGPIGLLKMFATRSAHEIADEAVQIFGGRALTQTGMGKTIEMFHR